MKRLGAFALACALALVGCGNSESSSSAAGVDSSSAETSVAVSTAPPSQTAEAAEEPQAPKAQVLLWSPPDPREWLRDAVAARDEQSPHTAPEPYGRDINELKAQLEDMMSDWYGEWSVYVKHLQTGETFSINEHSLYAASLIKMYCMACIYQEIENGTISESSVESELESMITVSSDECFNSLARRLGLGYINSWCEEQGYPATFQCHGLGKNYNSYGLDMYINDMNRTSVEDCGRLLESIYKGECVSENASAKMLSRLLRQTINGKIPTGLPEGTRVAHKTGDTNNHTHDCGIIYSEGGDYVLCIMGATPSKGWDNSSRHREISRAVYEYFNPTENEDAEEA
ncbi:MAG: serine hydrolase [Ruminococcus sp.]|nr:serine hydrolase [Ruminococcus sp.]